MKNWLKRREFPFLFVNDIGEKVGIKVEKLKAKNDNLVGEKVGVRIK